MRHASKRCLNLIAICLGMTTPTWAQAVVFPETPFDDPAQAEEAIVISDETASVRLGQSASGSVTNVPQQVAQLPPSPYATNPDRFLGPAQPMFNGAMAPGDADLGFASTNRLDQILWRVGSVTMDQYGFKGGYTNINAFIPLFVENDRALFWVNPRVNITDYGRGAGNVGFGRRVYVPEEDRVYGASFWWDFDNGHIGRYNQMGGSFESIGRYVSLRGNFTLPIGKKETQYSFVNSAGQFVGNNISILQTFSTEQAYEQYDGEIATPFPLLGAYGFDLGLGAYLLSGAQATNATGVSVRTQAQITEDFWINGIYTYDNIFKSMFSLNFELTMPDGMPARWFRRNPVSTYLTQSVVRRYRVPVTTTQTSRTILATQNGSVINIAFIDPNLSTSGNGSNTTPFNSVADYMAAGNKASFDLIFVNARTDNSDTNLNTTITLLNDQKLVGAGTSASITTDQGSVPLPTVAGSIPLLSNSNAVGQNVVTLANNNEVVGFKIDAGNSASGIAGTNIAGFNIHNNTIENVINGITITSDTSGAAGGTANGIIQSNIITGSTDTADPSPSLAGISLVHNAGKLNLLINSNTISGFDEDANGNGTLDHEDTNNNGVLDPGEIDLDFDGIADGPEDLNNNNQRDGIGIQVIANGGTINAQDPTGKSTPIATGITNNSVLGSANGLAVRAEATSTVNLAVNNNTMTNLTYDNGAAFHLTADMGTLNLYSFQENTVTYNSALLTPTHLSQAQNLGNGAIFEVANGGQFTLGDPNAPAGTPVFLSNQFLNSSGTGVILKITDSQVTVDDLSGFTINGNTGNGFEIDVSGAAGSLTVNNPISGVTFSNNTGDGLVVTASNNATVNMYFGYLDSTGVTHGNSFTGNGGSGLILNSNSGATFNTALVGNRFGQSTYSAASTAGNGADGAQLNANGGSFDLTGGSFQVTSNGVTSTVTSSGIFGTRDSTTGVASQTFVGNGNNGLTITAANGGSINVPFVSGNSFDDNTAAGLFIGGQGTSGNPATINLGTVVNNSFNRINNGTTGILFNSTGTNTVLNLARNTFTGGNANTQFGIGGTVKDGGLTLRLNASNAGNLNSFSNNVDAHIGLTFAGNSANTVQITRGTFTAASDNAATSDFNGDGVALHLLDTATLTGFVTASTFTNNAGDGLNITANGSNTAGNNGTPSAAVNNFQIGGADPAQGNLFQNNGTPNSTIANVGNGLSVVSIVRGQFNNMLVQNNTFDSNVLNGVFVESANADQETFQNKSPNSINLISNTMTNNGTNGIHFFLVADSDLIANLDLNDIGSNGGNGILASELTADPHDTRSITGRWTRNLIANNVDDGIDLRANFGNANTQFNPDLGNALVIGDATVNAVGTYSDFGNVITNNGRDGIDITQGGFVTVGNNEISFNGQLASNPFAVAGINISGPEFENGTIFNPGEFYVPIDDALPGAFQNVRIVSNLINENNGDGIQWINESGVDALPYTSAAALTAINNLIAENVGRGMDLLERNGDADTNDSDNIDPNGVPQGTAVAGISGAATIVGNHIMGNGQEGIYVVATAATAQRADVASNVALAQNGGDLTAYFLTLDVHNNQIVGNGNQVVDFPATGLVIRVGTTGGGYSAFFDGGFATTGTNAEDVNGDGILDNDLNGNGYLDASTNFVGLGGISASVTGNFFDGNLGNDVLFHSFTSTNGGAAIGPPTSSGTWSTTQFNLTSYNADPLARMDLIFQGNTFNSLEANNSDSTITPDGEVGAYYNNGEGTFKSRTFAPNNASAGPFRQNGGATRRRNAQRLASRYTTNPGGELAPWPSVPGGADQFFLYAGMGDSTFRVRGTSNTFTDPNLGTVNIGSIFILDNPAIVGDPTIVDATFEANGVFFTPLTQFGELPFGWGQF